MAKTKIARMNALKAITEAISNNDIEIANGIFSIVLHSIETDRHCNKISENIELTQKEKKFFTGNYKKFLQ